MVAGIFFNWLSGVPSGRVYPALLVLLNVTSISFALVFLLKKFKLRKLQLLQNVEKCPRLLCFATLLRWCRFLTAVVLPYMVISLWVFRFLGVCRNDAVLLPGTGNSCPGHFGIGSAFGAVGMVSALLEFKMMTTSLTMAQFELISQTSLGITLIIITHSGLNILVL